MYTLLTTRMIMEKYELSRTRVLRKLKQFKMEPIATVGKQQAWLSWQILMVF